MSEHVLRLCRYMDGGEPVPALASLKHQSVIPIAEIEGYGHVKSMSDVLSFSDLELDRLEGIFGAFEVNPLTLTSRPLADVRLEAPFERPLHIRAALSFEDHLINASRKVGMGPVLRAIDRSIEALFGRRRSLAAKANKAFYEQPPYYKASVSCITGPYGQVKRPGYASELDYEVELGCVLGQTVESASPDEASAAIFGYVMFNDFSAREQQFKEMRARLGPSKGKDFNNSNAFGPFLIPKRYIDSPYTLDFRVSKNGDRINEPAITGVYWRFDDILAHISQDEVLHAGEVVLLGCCGHGSGLEMGVSLNVGDRITISNALFGEMSHEVL